MKMSVRIVTPSEIVFQATVDRIRIDAEEGSIGLLPKHVDYTTILVPGILRLTHNFRQELFAIDQGVLVKKADEVHISTWNAVRGTDLGELRRIVKQRAQEVTEHDRKGREALASLEAELMKRITVLDEERSF